MADPHKELLIAADALACDPRDQSDQAISALSTSTCRALLAAVLQHVARRDHHLAEEVFRVLSTIVSAEVLRGPATAQDIAAALRRQPRGRGQVTRRESKLPIGDVGAVERDLRRFAKSHPTPTKKQLHDRLQRTWCGLGNDGPIPGRIVDRFQTGRSLHAAALELVAEAHGVVDTDSLRRAVRRAEGRR